MIKHLDCKRVQVVDNSQYRTPSSRYAWRALLVNLLPYFLLLGFAPVIAGQSVAAAWLLLPLIGLYVYRLTIVMHDCTHYSLFAQRHRNKQIGICLGAVTGIDFRSFSYQHLKHHRLYGQPRDPQGFHYEKLGSASRGRFLWHLFKPLLGLNLIHTLRESILSPRNFYRAVKNGEIFLIVLVQAVILAIVTGFGQYPVLALLPMLSAATFGLFFSQLRGIAEHGTVDNEQAHGMVRSHTPHWVDRLLLYALNFNYHAEHHRFPNIPSCHLRSLHQQLPVGDQQTPSSMLRTIYALYSGLGRS